jgi:iron complex transport system ATP-binding protein
MPVVRAPARETPGGRVLTTTGLSFGYTARTGAPFSLHDVTLHVEHGSLTGLLGPNGCGKTTLLKLLSGVLSPASGAVALDDRPIAAMSRREVARRLAVVPQETHPIFDYTVMEMVLMGRHPFLRLFELEGPDDVAIAHDAMAATGTLHLAERSYMTLSGGEKQRVIVASALAQQPSILLLDEPTASLDLAYQLEISTLLDDLNRNRAITMVLATHDLNLAAARCDRLVLLRAGRVVAQGRTEDVLTAGTIRMLYGVEAEVRRHPDTGQLSVFPLRRVS